MKPSSYATIATQYARAVVAGKIPTCKWVKQACQRQLDDLAKFNQILQLRMAGKPVIDIITPPSPGRVTANWVGKRVRIKKGIDNYKWYATKSDIGNDTKVKTAILDLSGGKVPSSWVKDWRVSDRTTKTMRINTSTIPLSFNWITIVIEFLQIKIPVTGSTAFTYVWVNNSNWELV